jgi:hypothetical protein
LRAVTTLGLTAAPRPPPGPSRGSG